MINIGLFGSCQLHICSDIFFNEIVKTNNNINVIFSIPFYEYDNNYPYFKGILNYKIFDNLDILIIENNNLNNQASSSKIIDYCLNKNNKMKIIKTTLLKFPIFPINWSGYGENINDYKVFDISDNINYKNKFDEIILSLEKNIIRSDININIINFIKDNFNLKLLFHHSLHPTNILLYELWRSIFDNININIDNYKFNLNNEILPLDWINPFTKKMISDLDIKFNCDIDDQFYINRYFLNKNLIN